MTKKQARTLMGLCVAMILTMILCTKLILHSLETVRIAANQAQEASLQRIALQKQAADRQEAEASVLPLEENGQHISLWHGVRIKGVIFDPVTVQSLPIR